VESFCFHAVRRSNIHTASSTIADEMTFLSLLLGHIIFAAVFAALIGLRSPRAQLVAGKKVLSYPVLLKSLGAVGFVVLSVGTSYIMAKSEGLEQVIVAALMLPMTFLAFLGCIEVFSTRITYDEDCVYQSSVFSRTSALRFDDVIEVSWSELWSQHLIRDATRDVVRVSKFMIGAEELVQEVIERIIAKS
jgi:hypothetical protein